MRATSFLALTFLLIAITLGAEANPPEGTTVHVATDGDDRNPGTADRPLATLAAARDRVRTEKASRGGPITVVVRGGTYYLPETLALTPEDSGSATAPIVYLRGGRRNARPQRRGQAGVELAAASGRRLEGRDTRRPGHRPGLCQRRAAAHGPLSQL